MEKFWLNNYLIIFICLLIINLVKISSLELNLNCQNLSQIISKDNSELISLAVQNFIVRTLHFYQFSIK